VEELTELRILAVDDEPANLLLLSRMLERAGYTQVETTTEPTRVPERFVAERPDLMLLDLHMPAMDGFELMERLAPLTEAGTQVPFLVLRAAGAADYLTKPLDVEQLMAVLAGDVTAPTS
jgi:CheY-like chemotaxis protein